MTGVARGLQSRCGVDKVPGGFDSHSPSPLLLLGESIYSRLPTQEGCNQYDINRKRTLCRQ